MKILSTNTGEKRVVQWGTKNVVTGIFKSPVSEGIFLGTEDVEGDVVYDRKYHGGIDKACYAFGANHYAYWKTKFPNLDWNYGMFGENLTIDDFNEKHVFIGDTFEVGEAIIQVSEPRQPCMKLNVRFNSNKMVKMFTQYGYCGSYFRVIQPGFVREGDKMHLVEPGTPEISLFDVFRLIYSNEDSVLREIAINHPQLGQTTVDNLR